MKAAVLHAPGDVRIEDLEIPTPASDEVLIRVSHNGLCGTDATEYTKGPMMVPLLKVHPGSGHLGPTTLGHEFIGTVVGAGAEATDWVGKRVASGAGVHCGKCRWCLAGKTNLCAQYYTLGLSTHGGLAEFAVSPARIVREIPDAVMDIDAALAQPQAVGLHAVRQAGLAEGDRVVLLGVGAIGSFVCSALSRHGGPVIAVDVDQRRLDIARQLGATDAILISRDTSAAQLREVVGPDVDVVFETSGAPGAAERAFALPVMGGKVVLVGLNKTPQPLNLAEIVLREIDVRTTVAHVCDQDLSEALDLVGDRKLSELLVDRVIPLSDIVQGGLEPLASGQLLGKVLVDPRLG